MLRWRRFVSAFGVVLTALALAGCAIVDKYSDRAVEYNLQAEKTQQQNLLLNVIRASLRRPMQFTGLQSITGTASASGSVTGGYTNAHQTPYISLFPPAISTPPNTQTAISRAVTSTGSGTASMSGGPTFVVPVLDTQEFYQGILAPVSHQIIDYYVKQGYPPEILFDLFVASVDVISTDSKKCERFTFKNDVRDPVNFTLFQAMADYLIGSGFTTERVSDIKPFGPSIPTHNPAQAATLLEAYSKAAAAGLELKGPSAPVSKAARKEPTGLNLQKRSSKYRFCFIRDARITARWLGPPEDQAYCGYSAVKRTQNSASGEHCGIFGTSEQQGAGDGGSSQFSGVLLSELFLRRLDQIRHESKHSADDTRFFPTDLFHRKRVTFQFNTRSVEGILYYLGEITRLHLGFEDLNPRVTQVKIGLPYGSIPTSECSSDGDDGARKRKSDLMHLSNGKSDSREYSCENLFVLDTGPGTEPIYSVSYNNTTFYVPTDRARAGRTLQVLELVKQLLALNTSAKQLPSSGVISIIGGSAQ